VRSWSEPGEADAATVAGDAGAAGAASAAGDAGAALVAGTRRRRFAALRRFTPRFPHPPFQSRRGLFVLFVLVAGIGSLLTIGSVVAIQWTETAAFCGQCHTMEPELKAYELSPHREVACVECHTEPGVAGWVKAKVNGTRQLVQILTGTFSMPIPPPDHANLPPTSLTCLKCHDTAPLVAQGGPVKLVLHNRYNLDEDVTRDSIALVLRPFGFGGSGDTRGVHWHIDSDVEYVPSDGRAQKIDYVAITRDDGEREEYIASSAVTMSNAVGPDIERLQDTGRLRRMDCIDCHNRIGHAIPDLGQAIDEQLDAGTVSRELPYVKREATARLAAEYATDADADLAIEGLRAFYEQRYPLVARNQREAVDTTIASLKTIYRLVATPAMRVSAATYPNNIGHQTAPGCFRCHDGAHYKVVGGAMTSQTIPSQCATCHTFPQIGAIESGVLIGERPDNHNDRLWVFSHKASVVSADPAGQTCAACHTKNYCENCHATTAVKVSHDSMVTGHATVTREIGAASCAYCHQPAYCAQCHSNEVLPVGPAGNGQAAFPVLDEDRFTDVPP
jgi:nitrate/TMAO reductase-like tetraheme cytochrome c subunit